MNILLLFFALPIATIILSIVLQKILKCPILVAATFFAIYLIVAFAIFDSGFLIFVILGYGLLRVLDHFVPDHHDDIKMSKKEADNNLAHIGLVSSIALVIHNIVEGMAVYSTVLSNVTAGLMLAIGIGFHNLPLGMVIAMTFYQGSQKTIKGLVVLCGVAFSTLVGGVLSFFLNNQMLPEWVLGSLLSLTLGMLLFILISELFPRIRNTKYKKERNFGLVIGLIIMLISLMI